MIHIFNILAIFFLTFLTSYIFAFWSIDTFGVNASMWLTVGGFLIGFFLPVLMIKFFYGNISDKKDVDRK